MSNTTNQKPAITLRDGRISASVWENKSEKGDFHSVTFQRAYTDAAGATKNAASFSGTELLKLSRLAARAYDEIKARRADDANHEREGE
jgi:hypothetical protein